MTSTSTSTPAPVFTLRMDGCDVLTEVSRDKALRYVEHLDICDYQPDAEFQSTTEITGHLVDDEGEIAETLIGLLHPAPIAEDWPVASATDARGDGGGICWVETRRRPYGKPIALRVRVSTWFQCPSTGKVLGTGYTVLGRADEGGVE